MKRLYYISFAHARPNGFIGAAIVEAGDEVSALRQTISLDINAGDEAAIVPLPDPPTPGGPVPIIYLNRLLGRAELEACFGEIEKGPAPAVAERLCPQRNIPGHLH